MTSKRVLIVEDFFALGRALGDILKLEGFEVEHARNGKEAVNRLETLPIPDAVILDYRMPVMTGGELLDWIKSKPNLEDVTTIATSAAANQSHCAKADHFLRKPLDTQELIGILRKACQS